MALCLISIGSNLGDRSLAIDSALAELQSHPAISLHQISSRHTTHPIGGPTGQGDFINAAALIETALPPHELLKLLRMLESRAGRTRNIRWSARQLDLDLLLYDDLVLNDERLVLPHPGMAFRRFVLEPAVEVAPDMPHPILGRSVMQLLAHLERSANYVAITGVPALGKSPGVKSRLATSVAAQVGGAAILEPRPSNRPATPAASPAWQPELEFLTVRCELLRDVTASGKEPFAISDFWLDQSLAYAKELYPDDYRQVASAWSRSSEQAASPKLIVFVETTFTGAPHDPQTEKLIAVQNNLREQLLAAGQPPTLTLKAANPSWNEEEVAAAVLSM